MTGELGEAISALLLPISPEQEQNCVTAIKLELERRGIAQEDQATWLRLETERWNDQGCPSTELKTVVAKALVSADSEFGERLSKAYWKLYDVLRQNHGFSHNEARILLSHTGLIARLAQWGRMSAAQIASLLASRYSHAGISWRSVQPILHELGLKPQLEFGSVESRWKRDSELEQREFADADEKVSASIVGEVGTRLGFPGDLEALLLDLYPPSGERFGPYLQILLFTCTIVEFFDHPPTILYEFSPRGKVANWLFRQFPEEFTSADNPVLNNAKAVERLDLEWAGSRKTHTAAARALAGVVMGLEEMAFMARRELAGWLRRWIMRLIRLTEPLTNQIPEDIPDEMVLRVLSHVAEHETRTSGIIEQRIVDALAYLQHPLEDGWRSRGIGDSVNASNTSRRKLGDCDFQNAAGRRVVAYEAHAGKLTNVYVNDHLRTLAPILSLRLEEWEGIADSSEWQVEVIFVAHQLDEQLQLGDRDIGGIRLGIRATTFAELAHESQSSPTLNETFRRLVVQPLNERRTPNRVRKVFLEMASDTCQD